MNIVLLGGGTGLSTNAGDFADEHHREKSSFTRLDVIQHPWDDGGHTNLVQQQFGIWPGVGDFRKSILALAEPGLDADMHRKFNKRFTCIGLEGVSLGNLFLAASMGPNKGHDHGLVRAIRTMMKALQVSEQFHVHPISCDRAVLVAHLKDGGKIVGEAEIGKHHDAGEHRIVSVELEPPLGYPPPALYNGAEDAIVNADKLIITSGSQWTSLEPHFQVHGFIEAISKSHATVYMVMNATTKNDEASGWNSADFIERIFKGIGRSIDVVLYYDFSNVHVLPQLIIDEILAKYDTGEFFPVSFRETFNAKVGRFIGGPFASWTGDGFRHNGEIVKAILSQE